MTTTSEIPKNLSKSAKKREKKNADKSENPPLMKSAKKREKKPKIATKGEETSENTEKPTLSKSAKKREKKLKNPDHVHESAAQSKALRYLKLWHTNKEEWKFEKCRQIWLLQNCYNSTKIPKDDFKLLLKYMKTIQGKMRNLALDEAKDKIGLDEKWTKLSDEDGKLDGDIEKELGKAKPDEISLKRAKKIIKKLDKEPSE